MPQLWCLEWPGSEAPSTDRPCEAWRDLPGTMSVTICWGSSVGSGGRLVTVADLVAVESCMELVRSLNSEIETPKSCVKLKHHQIAYK